MSFVVVHSINMRFCVCFAGNLIIKNLEITMETTGTSTHLNITFISTGGPATIVTWTRGSDPVPEGIETVLNDRVIAQYTHTLTMTEATTISITYGCRISNNRPSSVTIDASIHIYEGMSMYLYMPS